MIVDSEGEVGVQSNPIRTMGLGMVGDANRGKGRGSIHK
jgi:hypothetical protein